MSQNIFYRLTNDYNGPTWALDVLPDGSGNLKIARVGNFSGQYWRLEPSKVAGKYRLTTLYKGAEMSLDIINDGKNDTPHLASTGNFTGQFWTLTKVEREGSTGDIFKLSNDFTGTEKFLDVYPDQMKPRMTSGDPTGSHWTLTLAKI